MHNNISRRSHILLIALVIFMMSAFPSFAHDERFDNHLVVDGVDVSRYQDTGSDWESVKEHGYEFAIMRLTLTYSNSGRMGNDSSFVEHYKKTGEAGMLRGVYVFSQALNAEEGEKEAKFAIKRLKELGIGPADLELPVYMDYEFYHKDASRLKSLTPEDAKEAANAFCETITSAGYDAGVYANTSFFVGYLDNGESLPKNTSVWCAQYNDTNDSGCDYEIWQYSSTSTVPYIYENGSDKLDGVDTNYWYISKEPNENTKVRISGNTNVEYTGKPVLPDLTIKDGTKTLKEGKDYTISGLNNIEAGSEAYAYIKGHGKYKGYALIPFNIGTGFTRLNLPSEVIESTDYKILADEGGTRIVNVPDDATVEEVLSHIKVQGEEMRLGIVDAQGNELTDDSNICFSDMLGIFSDMTLVGTIDLTLSNENRINYLERK